MDSRLPRRAPKNWGSLADFGSAARRLWKSPGSTVTVIAILALGIGANTTIFSLMNAVLLRTLPVREPDRLVLFNLASPGGSSHYMIPRTVFRELRDKNSVLDGFAAATFPPITISGDRVAERLNGLLVSGAFFETLGVEAVLGRVLTPQDDNLPVSPAVCVISHGLWQRRFGGDLGVIGREIRVNAHPFTVIGVTPQDFLGLSEDSRLDITIPLNAAGMSEFAAFPVRTFGRLKHNVSPAQARDSLDNLYHQVATEAFGGKPADFKVELRSGSQGFSGLRTQYERALWILMATVGLVLLIACANVTILLLARNTRRAKELAVRLALGAGRVRLARQLFTENALLAISGALLGIALAYWAVNALLALAPRQIGGGDLNLDVAPDWSVLLFTAGVTMLVSILCGLPPAIQSARADPGPVLKGTSGSHAHGRLWFNNALAVSQVALTLVLLIAAGLFMRSLHNLKSVDPGLNPDRMVLLTLDPGTSGYSAAASNQLAERLVERARFLPGVVAVSPAFISPLSGGFAITRISVPGYEPGPDDPDSLDVNWIGEDYFKVLGTPLLAGRAFAKQDGLANKVVIVNEKTAKHFWPGESAVGKLAIIDGDQGGAYQIVGVVKDVRRVSLRREADATVYLPFPRNARPHFVLLARVSGETAPVIPALRRELHALATDVAVFEATTMAAQLDRTMMFDHMMTVLTILFGLLAAILSAVGLYGVMAFSVATRTREFGIRMALGADYSRVLGQVLKQSILLIAVGVAIGVPFALWSSRFAASYLHGLSATDPPTYVLLVLILTAIGLFAVWIPARRAAAVNPTVALKYE